MRPHTSLVLLLFPPILLLAQTSEPSENTGRTPPTYAQCLIELDAVTALATNETRRNLAAVTAAGSLAASIDRTAVDARLAELEELCAPLPQLAHNRGVLAASTERWPEAVAHLERSLLQDRRAAETYRLLQDIYEYQASLAYAKALDTPLNTPRPTLQWQDSTVHNADATAQLRGAVTDELGQSLRSVSTVEYELFSWWHALHGPAEVKAFYVDDFPVASINRSRRRHANRQWEELHHEISFTATDAVVVLGDALKSRTLLLLRRVGTRWKIYQETFL